MSVDTATFQQPWAAALLRIVNVLGPDTVACSSCCEGCRAEMAEALGIARRAMGLDDIRQETTG